MTETHRRSVTRHGGRLLAAQGLFEASEPWLDLSSGVNPTPYPAPRASDRARTRLPEPEELAALEEAAATAFGVSDPARVVAAPGSETMIGTLPLMLTAGRVAIAGPTYGSHAEAWRAAGVGVEERLDPRAPVAVAVHPNNPDGRLFSAADLERELQRRQYLILDEAFIETRPEASFTPLAGSRGHEALVTLRSFGKFYGLPGLRLGFVVAARPLAQLLRRMLGDWSVSADAIAAGMAAYGDPDWAERTRAALEASARRLDGLLDRAGFAAVGGTSLFRLVRSADAATIFERLGRAGILVRPFDWDETLLRVGVPGSPADWTRLEAGLAALG